MEQLLTLEAGYSKKQLKVVLLIEYTATSLLEGSIMDWGEQFWSHRWSIGYLVSGQTEGIRWWKHPVQGKALGCNHLDARLYYQAKQGTLSPLLCRMLPQASWEEIMASVNTYWDLQESVPSLHSFILINRVQTCAGECGLAEKLKLV